MVKKKISVVIPAYNAAEFIVETVESVLCQSHDNFEVIVVDDGSKDHTHELVATTFGERIRLLKKPNGGVSSARNMGVAEASGDYIAFLDADDIWHPDKLLVQARALELFPESGVCYSDVAVSKNRTRGLSYPVFRDHSWTYDDIFDGKALLRIEKEGARQGEYSLHSGDIFKYLMYNGMILPSASMIRRSLLEESKIAWDEADTYSEDSDYFMRLSMVTNFTYVDFPLITYRSVNTGERLSANRNNPFRIRGFLRSIEKNASAAGKRAQVNERWVRYCLSRSYRKLGYYYLSEIELKEAREPLLCALKHYSGDFTLYPMYFASFFPARLFMILKLLKRKYRGR